MSEKKKFEEPKIRELSEEDLDALYQESDDYKVIDAFAIDGGRY